MKDISEMKDIESIKKEFDSFRMIKGETLYSMFDRYCNLMVQMRKLGLEKRQEEQIEKLASALPVGNWTNMLSC